ncbi:MAG: hypothetical protein ACO3RM_09430 [Paracoccaceae bacterium]|nr:hypothetical protein [Rhodobacterales bacterium]NCX58768.1 hypothetical protein [Paracoccaceae bacterium]NCX70753.1 hypothetical protein [Paracoccaceae bacterium]
MSSVKTIAFCSTILLLATLSTSWASGLEEAEVLSPIVSPTQPCKISLVTNETDYDQALFHYAVAVGQETQKAHLSAGNMVRSHQAARLQSCNQHAKAVTDGHGKPVRDGFSQIIINY